MLNNCFNVNPNELIFFCIFRKSCLISTQPRSQSEFPFHLQCTVCDAASTPSAAENKTEWKFNLHDTGTVGQVRVGTAAAVVAHLSVFGLGVVLPAARIRFHLLFEGEWVGEDAEALLQLPATGFADRLRSTDRLCQHESTNHSHQLNEGHGERSGRDKAGAFLDNEVESRQAAGAVEVRALVFGGVGVPVQGRTAAVRNHRLIILVIENSRPIFGRVNATTFQLKAKKRKKQENVNVRLVSNSDKNSRRVVALS